jgi:hypothetical protein
MTTWSFASSPWRIHADRFEHFRILNQTIPLKPGLSKLPAIVVALFVVNLPTPAFVFPARCADEDVAGGETFDRWLQRLSQGVLGGGEEVGHGAVYQFQATATTF